MNLQFLKYHLFLMFLLNLQRLIGLRFLYYLLYR
jgi:hypothetical protein